MSSERVEDWGSMVMEHYDQYNKLYGILGRVFEQEGSKESKKEE